MSSSTPTHSLISIQKASPSSSSSKSKRVVLPKADLIQFYIENSDQSKSPTSSSPNQANAKCRVLPKFNNQDVIKHLNFSSPKPATTLVASLAPSLSTIARTLTMASSSSEPCVAAASSTSTTSPCRSNAKQLSAQSKKCEKEKKFKEITRLCLNHSTHSAHQIHHTNASSSWLEQETCGGPNTAAGQVQASCSASHHHHAIGHQALSNSSNSDAGGAAGGSQSSEIRQLVKHLAREFLVDCRQRLDNDSFIKLLNILCSVKKESLPPFCATVDGDQMMDVDVADQPNEEEATLAGIFKLIRKDKHLLNKFSAFLTCEQALHFDLFPQTCQYEKCYDFFHKIELFVPNKVTFKKLMQSVISNCNFSSEYDTTTTKIEEIKNKLKSVAKNNALINFELDYLFDQRRTNLEPTYEKISLVNFDPNNNEDSLMPPVAQPLHVLSTQTSVNGGVPSSNQAPSTSTIQTSNLLDSFPLNESNQRKIYEKFIDNEFIDLTGEYPANYGTKKCTCSCHSASFSSFSSSLSTGAANQTTPGSHANSNELADEKSANQAASGPSFHCLACSLKILKGKLCIKCEGKKAVPLVYKIRD